MDENPLQGKDTHAYIYVADTENHCIRKIDLDEGTSHVFAGKCGNPGFMDGPFGENQFKNP